MSNTDNTAYFTKRAADERAKTETASDERAAAAHAEMAERYDTLAHKPGRGSPRLRIANEN
jgi:hypothetical protein